MYDCVVIGGGASGMMAAITAASNNINTCIVEHTDRIGTKILKTGNGKCNFTNMSMDSSMYQNDNKEFVMEIIDRFNVSETIAFFKRLGIYHKDKNGYVYPHSETAASLQNALRIEVERLGIDLLTGIECETIEKNVSEEGKLHYKLHFANNIHKVINTKCIIIATGSKASPKTGSDGSGYKIAKKLGMKIVKPLPALVQLVCDEKYAKVSSGVRSTGTVSVFCDGELIAKDYGEIQYTDYGISGIPVFQVSRFAVKAVDSGKKVQAVIDMLPDFSDEDVNYLLNTIFEKNRHKTVEQFFEGIINKKLVNMVCRNLKTDINQTLDNAGVKCIKRIVENMKCYKYNVTGFKDFEWGQICQGGIALDEVDVNLQSVRNPGIYLCGEVLDVDGKCGGYNLQWAWSSGYVAGVSVASRVKSARSWNGGYYEK
ncbi:MAG: aminoacetone oxidase family FAD-binding enzyme [Eubacteriales bacterium]|nr:aminoacetone oxidase family FAD-binding enzyme [Eubacteriales bacterium]